VLSITPQPDSVNPGFHWTTTPTQVSLSLPLFASYDILWEAASYPIHTLANSTITDLIFNQPQRQIRFNITGPSGTAGFCNVTIPKGLLQGDGWTITINGVIISTFTSTENATHTLLSFLVTHGSTSSIVIQGTWVIPEFPPIMILALLLSLSLLALGYHSHQGRKKLPKLR
jgi:hypothetical protein